MRVLTSLLLTFVLVACTAAAPSRNKALSLPEGEGIYLARYNPVACADPESHLGVEIKTVMGWERVRLEESGSPEDRAALLVDAFIKKPDQTLMVRGDFTRRHWPFGQGHGSRGFVVLELDPVPSAEDPNRSMSP